ncbi:MAG: toll/interleukin-1 receptor domain-containing protein [Planctomycetota bacterium]|nr:toll/interleukin-1 receptor domain-containing protein [Planctomycetota bacterium]
MSHLAPESCPQVRPEVADGDSWCRTLPKEFEDASWVSLCLTTQPAVTEHLVRLRDGRFCMVWWDVHGMLYRWSEVRPEYARDKAEPVRLYRGLTAWSQVFDSPAGVPSSNSREGTDSTASAKPLAGAVNGETKGDSDSVRVATRVDKSASTHAGGGEATPQDQDAAAGSGKKKLVASSVAKSAASSSFAVFLSHNSKDKPTVRELKRSLTTHGFAVWLDEDELRPGIPWQQLLESGIRASGSVAVLVGKDGFGPWEDEEMQAAIVLAVKDKRPVIPVLLPGAATQPELPMFLGNRTWVDLRSGLTDDGLAKLIWGITGKKPSP